MREPAALKTLPSSTGPDAAKSPVTIDEAAKVIGDNYFLYKLTAEQLRALQSWINQQRDLSKRKLQP
jgi:hypothetical protein